MPKISVIVPVYNSEKILKENALFITNQTFHDYEVIFINDGSTDSSLEILKTFQSDNVHIISQQNKGQANARNTGLKNARGEFICFVDIDDQINDNMLYELNKIQMETNADIVWCNANIIRNNEFQGMLDEKKYFVSDMQKNYFIHNASPWRKLIRKSLIEDHQLYYPDLRYYEDLAIVPVYGLYTEKIHYLDKPLYNYILHDESTMHQKTYNSNLENIFSSLENLKKEVIKSEIDVKEELEYLYIDHLLHAASLRFFMFDAFESLHKIVKIMENEYPEYKKNKYFIQKDWKYKLICNLFYREKYSILKLLLK